MAFIRTFHQGKRQYQALVQSVWNRDKKRSEQRVLKWLGRTSEPVSEENFSLSMSFRSTEEKFLVAALSKKRAMLMHGEWGVGKSFLAQRVCLLLKEAGYSAHYFRWTQPQGEFIKSICQALDLKTETEDGKRITQAELLTNIGIDLRGGQHILAIDKAHNIPLVVRNHIEVWLEGGAVILLVATLPKRAEMYLKFPRWELKPLEYFHSFRLVIAAAAHFKVKLNYRQARELATHANGNPQLLIRAVSEHDIGVLGDPDQPEWIDGTPFVLAACIGLAIIRYVGQGLSDKNLMVMGGISILIIRLFQIFTLRASRSRSKIQ